MSVSGIFSGTYDHYSDRFTWAAGRRIRSLGGSKPHWIWTLLDELTDLWGFSEARAASWKYWI